MKFTPAQSAAITQDANEILVSAAAGSGKTAVLTERILRHISNNIGIDRLLVVTFTEAAAAEMKERVTEKIHALLNSENPRHSGPDLGDSAQVGGIPGQARDDAGIDILHLSNQAALLATADISTIHAFCRKLVKEHFQVLDIDPSFRVADEAELGILKNQVMDEVFEEAYSQEDNAWFLDLADVYGGKAKDDGLDALVRRLYGFLESDPFPMAAATRYAQMFTPDTDIPLDDTPWAKLAKKELESGLEGIIDGLNQAMDICRLPDGPEKYIDKMEENLSCIQALKKGLAKTSFSESYQAFLNIDWGRLPAIREKDQVNAALKDRAQRIRDREVKARFKDLVKGVFFAEPKKMKADLQALAPRVTAMMTLVARYSEAFAAEKRKRNLLDFSDLEHFAITVLYPGGPEDMTPGPVADNLLAKYHEILIDEYQDSNKVQDLILSAVARQRFMVGDVKQSIYRFRRANPGLFVEKYKSFTPVEYINPEEEQSYIERSNLRIDLSQNFRSRAGVIDAVNFFFSQLMCPDVGEVDYNNAAALHIGADYPALPEDTFPGMWIELLEQSTQEEEEEESVSAVIAETRMIAACIHEIIATRRQVWDKDAGMYRDCNLGDIVILARSANSLAKDVIEELKNCGIDAVADVTAAFYEQLEIKTALAFLRITDNPRQGIDLTTILTSPVYDFTPDELLKIKKSPVDNESPDFYDYLISLSHTESKIALKVQQFLSDLETWRAAAVYMPISRLIGLIYDTTDYPSHAAALPGGDMRQANLRLLLEKAIEFEETSLKGLFHFIRYIEGIYASDSANQVSGAAALSEDMANRVRFMSIHKSKGLEFPVVIAGFLGKQFNLEDERKPIILHSEKGLGPKYVNLKKRTRSKTLAHYALSRLTRRENLSEELRCLYVAMTRAKELLILTGRTTNWARDMEKWSDAAAVPVLSTYYRQGAGKFLDLIMPCLLKHQDGISLTDDDTDRYFDEIYNHPARFDIRVHHDLVQFEAPEIEQYPKYPASQSPPPLSIPAVNLPSKLSISDIKRLYASDISPDSTPHQDPPPTFDPPAFLQDQTEGGITAMALGSALHAIAEHLDFHRHTTIDDIEQLIIQLKEKNLLTPEAAIAINRSKILKLALSPMADRIRASGNVYRETPFVMAIPANDLYADLPQTQESILVHGIIDLYFEEPDGLVLVDFKSESPGPDPKAWIQTHSTQLQIYKKAIEKATSSNVKEVLLYSFTGGVVLNANIAN
ncbi:MAG: helicase-exonuclease AddAB subunit AddA [Defluviitaleaceae bacterium]|nr:helicase-exonuclease AddAB subunit AddA [Defluviitaleaceae bacterium]